MPSNSKGLNYREEKLHGMSSRVSRVSRGGLKSKYTAEWMAGWLLFFFFFFWKKSQSITAERPGGRPVFNAVGKKKKKSKEMRGEKIKIEKKKKINTGHEH